MSYVVLDSIYTYKIGYIYMLTLSYFPCGVSKFLFLSQVINSAFDSHFRTCVRAQLIVVFRTLSCPSIINISCLPHVTPEKMVKIVINKFWISYSQVADLRDVTFVCWDIRRPLNMDSLVLRCESKELTTDRLQRIDVLEDCPIF